MEQAERDENIRMIRDSAAAVGSESDLARIRSLRFMAPGFDPAVGREMCALGWMGLRLPEHRGGAQFGALEFCALLEQLGRRLVPEPLLEASAIAPLLDDDLLATVLAGERIVLPAWQESAAGLMTLVQSHFNAGVVNGHKRFVPMAEGADAWLVTVREGFALVARNASGVTVHAESTQDGGRIADIEFVNAPARLLAIATDDAHRWQDEAALATAAYLQGVAERAFEISLEYLRVRKQFGKFIGSFQALQHRAADLSIKLALLRASIEAAAASIDVNASPFDRLAAISRAKARANDTALQVTREAIQLHGAIGYTDEHDIGLYLRKAMTLSNRFGSAREHRLRYQLARAEVA